MAAARRPGIAKVAAAKRSGRAESGLFGHLHEKSISHTLTMRKRATQTRFQSEGPSVGAPWLRLVFDIRARSPLVGKAVSKAPSAPDQTPRPRLFLQLGLVSEGGFEPPRAMRPLGPQPSAST